MHEALSGNTDLALAMIHDVSNMENISSFSASLEIENAVSFEQQTIVKTQNSVPEPTNELESVRDSLPRDRFDRITDTDQ